MFVRGVVFLAISIVAMYGFSDRLGEPKKKEKGKGSMLTKDEAFFLRAVIYNDGFGVTTRPQRQVVLKREVVELHKNRPVGTIRLLLEIVKGGRPTDARAAGVTGLALEEGPAYAVFWADGDLDSFDKAGADGRTDREKLVEQLEKSLANAEKIKDGKR
jgi:hypothetical protein